MTLTIHDVDQRSPEWLALRTGMVTASVVGQLVTHSTPNAIDVTCVSCAAIKTEPCVSKRTSLPIKTIHPERAEKARKASPVLTLADDKTVRSLAALLAAERIAGIDPDGTYVNRDIYRGIDSEPYARDAYSAHTGSAVKEVGFLVREFDGFSIGVSPDGLVDEDGGIEIKSPRRKGHIETVVSGQVPAAHIAQIQTALLVSGRDWWDFVSFAGGLNLWVKRVYPDPEWHRAIVAAAKQLEAVIAEIVTAYEAAVEGFPMTEPLPDPFEVELKL